MWTKVLWKRHIYGDQRQCYLFQTYACDLRFICYELLVYQLQIKSPICICNTSFIPICESKILIWEIQAELIHVTKIPIFGTTPPTIRWILHEVSRFSSYVIIACECRFPQSSASFIARQWSTGTCWSCLRYETHFLLKTWHECWLRVQVVDYYQGGQKILITLYCSYWYTTNLFTR